MGAPTDKKFHLSGDQILRLVPSLGGCIASDRVVVEGASVGCMYRDTPRNESDSGWQFVAGDESDAYMGDSANHGIYDVNTIANYDRDIIQFLSYPVGTTVERQDGRLVVTEGPEQPPSMTFLPAIQSGTMAIGHSFQVEVDSTLLRRIDEGDLVAWRPGLTAFFTLGGPPDAPDDVVDDFLANAGSGSCDRQRISEPGFSRASYRLVELSEDDRQPGLYGIAATPDARLMCVIYFDDGETAEQATRLWDSLAPRR